MAVMMLRMESNCRHIASHVLVDVDKKFTTTLMDRKKAFDSAENIAGSSIENIRFWDSAATFCRTDYGYPESVQYRTVLFLPAGFVHVHDGRSLYGTLSVRWQRMVVCKQTVMFEALHRETDIVLSTEGVEYETIQRGTV